jgi:hypothetical protein
MNQKCMERKETILISEGMAASLCIAVMIKQVTKQKVRVRDFAGWDCTVKPNYIHPLTKAFPPDFDCKPTKFDSLRAANVEKPVERRGLIEGAPALLVMPVIVKAVYEDVLLVLNAERQLLTVLPRHLHVLPAYFPFCADRKQESIYLAPGSEFDWTCVCGNNDEQRFYHCDIRGNELPPLADGGWEGHLACQSCGRVFHQDKLIVVDQNPKPCFVKGDQPSSDH